MKYAGLVLLMLFSLNSFAMTEEQWVQKVWAAKETQGSDNIDMDLNSLTPRQKQALATAAQDLADIWPDTILEGDYVLDPQGSLQVIYINKFINARGELVAYQFCFSHEAYYTGECDIDEDMSQCEHGSITGHGYISPNFKFHMRDHDNIEDFSD